MNIRPLTEDNLHAYQRLRLEALTKEPGSFVETVAEHQAIPLDIARDRLRSSSPQGNFVLGAFADGQFIGMAGFVRQTGEKTRHKGFIWGVYVNEQWRGKGIGRALLSELLRIAKLQPGLEQINLSVAINQKTAKGLYSSLGFQMYGREVRALKTTDGNYIDEDLMVLHIESSA